MGLSRSFNNLLEVRLTSADVDGAYDLIMRKGISIYSVFKVDELTTGFTVRKADYDALKKLLGTRGETISVYDKSGIYWTVQRLAKRPCICIASILILMLTLFLPTRVLFYKVNGNITVPEREIIDAAYQCGIEFGTDRHLIRNENFKNKMLSLLPEIEWVGINTRGCVAIISVQEKGGSPEYIDDAPSNIVAARDAVISSIVVSKGVSHCAVGDAVLKGQLLISGYTDCEKVLLQGRAAGEIYGYTSRELNAVIPLTAVDKEDIMNEEHHYSIVIGKKRINLWKGSGICPTTCDRIYQEYWIQLPGRYTLPVCLIRETIRFYDVSESNADNSEDAILMSMVRYLQEHMTAGSILHQDIRFVEGQGILVATGIFGCNEIIGLQKSERLGEMYG